MEAFIGHYHCLSHWWLGTNIGQTSISTTQVPDWVSVVSLSVDRSEFPSSGKARYLKYHCCAGEGNWATVMSKYHRTDCQEGTWLQRYLVRYLRCHWWWVTEWGQKPPLDSAGAAQTVAPTTPVPSTPPHIPTCCRAHHQPNVPKRGQMRPKGAKVGETGQKLSNVVTAG